MATTYIAIDPAAPGGKGTELKTAIDMLEAARERLSTLKAQMETMIDGPQYGLLETRFGVATGNGQATYNLVSGALTDLNGANIIQAILRLG